MVSFPEPQIRGPDTRQTGFPREVKKGVNESMRSTTSQIIKHPSLAAPETHPRDCPQLQLFCGQKLIETVQNSTSKPPILILRPQPENPSRIPDYKVFRTSMFNRPHRICKRTPRKQRMCITLLTLP